MDLNTNSAIAQAVAALHDYVTGSTTFQGRVLAESQDQAEPHVYIIQTEEDSVRIAEIRPYALIYPTPAQETWVPADASSYIPTGACTLELADINRHPGIDYASRKRSAMNFLIWFGEVINDILGQAATGTLRFLSVKRLEGPYRCPTEQEAANRGGYWWVRYQFNWGTRV